jgi:hypothetical protein
LGCAIRAAPPVLRTELSKRKLEEEKVKTCRFGSAKWFWHSIFPQDAEAGERHSTAIDWLEIV